MRNLVGTNGVRIPAGVGGESLLDKLKASYAEEAFKSPMVQSAAAGVVAGGLLVSLLYFAWKNER